MHRVWSCSDFLVSVTRLGISWSLAGWQAMYLASFVNAIGSASESASALLLINNAATWVVDMCDGLCLCRVLIPTDAEC